MRFAADGGGGLGLSSCGRRRSEGGLMSVGEGCEGTKPLPGSWQPATRLPSFSARQRPKGFVMQTLETRSWRSTPRSEAKIFCPLIAVSGFAAFRFGLADNSGFHLTALSVFFVTAALAATLIMALSIARSTTLTVSDDGFEIRGWRGTYACDWSELAKFSVVPSPSRQAPLIGITFSDEAVRRRNWYTRYTRKTIGCDRCRTNDWEISTSDLVGILNSYLLNARNRFTFVSGS
jgi:hypothetical protein